MRWNNSEVTPRMGVRIRVPGTLLVSDCRVLEVYETHVIVKIGERFAQVPPEAILQVYTADEMADFELGIAKGEFTD